MSGSDFPLFQIRVKAVFPLAKDGLYLTASACMAREPSRHQHFIFIDLPYSTEQSV